MVSGEGYAACLLYFTKYPIPARITAAVYLKTYNLRGQEVRRLLEANQNAGNYEIHRDGRDDFGNEVASGVYLYRLQAGEQVAVKKLTMLR
ncbi:MAG TPA: FlgD immunoglobulin-like domain containing protein [bacterium]